MYREIVAEVYSIRQGDGDVVLQVNRNVTMFYE